MAQYQGGLAEQLQALIPVANFHGMYDAADYLTAIVTNIDKRAKEAEWPRT